ncbi:MAG: cation:proton antiporter [Vicinamibacterales bacterium]
MPGHSIVQDLVVLYALAFVLLLVAGRLRAPAIVSLILTGVLAGPGGQGRVGSEETVTILSEIGVALLLFMVGLDLPFGDIWRLWRKMALAAARRWLAPWPRPHRWHCCGLAARRRRCCSWRSSSPCRARRSSCASSPRRNELHSLHGSLALGVPCSRTCSRCRSRVLLAPVLFGSGDASLTRALLQIVVIAVGLTAVTRFLLPPLFRLASGAGREAFGLDGAGRQPGHRLARVDAGPLDDGRRVRGPRDRRERVQPPDPCRDSSAPATC